jgi:hypothetical protein
MVLKHSEAINNDGHVGTYEPERSSALERIVENVHATNTKDQLYLFKPKEGI